VGGRGGRGSCGTLGVNRNAERILVVKNKEERFLGRLKHKLYDNIKMDLKEIGMGGMDWRYLAQRQEVGCCEPGRDELSNCQLLN
jgi:hypothetical protein